MNINKLGNSDIPINIARDSVLILFTPISAAHSQNK